MNTNFYEIIILFIDILAKMLWGKKKERGGGFDRQTDIRGRDTVETKIVFLNSYSFERCLVLNIVYLFLGIYS